MTTKSPHQQRVELFMEHARQPAPVVPTEPNARTCELRAALIMEEALETCNALGVVVTANNLDLNDPELDTHAELLFGSVCPPDLVAIADGCADISVVTIGTLSACGIADESLFLAVDTNNLDKFGPGHSWNEAGKLIKPPGHEPPDIRKVLLDQGWQS